MKRADVIAEMIKRANSLLKAWDRDTFDSIWRMCSDWNGSHEDDEIFMCEYQSDDSEYVNGFMIEDDYWVFEF